MTDFTLELKQQLAPILAPPAATDALREQYQETPALPTKVLLLTCVDYRYPRRILDAMDEIGYAGRYYHLALAGASLGATTEPHGRVVFEEHVRFADEHGHVVGVVVIDHLDCAASRVKYEFLRYDFATEYCRHQVHLKLVDEVVKRVPRAKASGVTTPLPVLRLLLPAEQVIDSVPDPGKKCLELSGGGRKKS